MRTSGSGDLWDVLKGALLMRITRINFVSITAAFALAGVLCAGVWTLVSPARFVSTTVMRAAIANAPSEPETSMRLLLQSEQEVLSRRSLSEFIQRTALYPEERTKLPLEEIIHRMRQSDIQIRVLERNGNFLRFAVEFTYPDAARAERGAGDLASAMRTTLAKSGKVTMIDTSSLPVREKHVDTKRLLAGGLLGGLAAGLLCGTVYKLARDRRRWNARRVVSFAALGMAAGIA